VGKPDQPRDKKGRYASRGGTFAVVLSLGLGMAYFSTGGSSGTGSTAARPSTSSSVKAKDRSFTTVVSKLQRQGRTIQRLDEAFDTDCAANSYGQVHDFFAAQPCEAMGRAVFEIVEGADRIIVAVSVVDMPDAEQARTYQRLVDTHGTGNVTELRASRRVTWTGKHYESALNETTVVNAQAEPAGRTATAARLASAVAAAIPN